MKQILKQAYFNILTINSTLKKINLVLIAYFAISSAYANHHPIIIQQYNIVVKDSSGIDSTKTKNVVLITDSSKLFTNLLSTSANKSPGFAINAEAKFFVDDYRADYIKSTNAACRILKDLYAKYEDWLLVIAAYNTGAGNVNKAIAKAGSKNFWNIQYYLPLETRNHVKKFIATHYFFEGNGSIATVTGDEIKSTGARKDTYFELAANCTTVNLYGKYNSVVIANNLMMDIALFNQ